MSSITTQQAKLDLELVPKEKRLEIRKFNERLNPGKIQREPIFQVVLDALALTSCYSVFLITADVPEVYMHQFWDSVYKHDTFYIFEMDKRKRFKLTLEIFRDIFTICPRIIPSVTSEGTGVKPGVPDVTEEESSESEAESWGNDEDDSKNEQDSSDEDSYQENDSDNYKTQSNNDNESNSEHKTDENESGSESNQEENKHVEEEVKDELVKTQSNNSNDEDETKITNKR
ncbi:hypothetical protein Tco_0521765 [Tanacetum coccineum]